MDNNDRGVKEGYYQMNKAKGVDYILRATNCPAIIIEPEFVQCSENILDKREEACKAIAETLSKFTFTTPKRKTSRGKPRRGKTK